MGSDAETGGSVSPLCPLESLNAQFDPTTKLMKRNGRTGESPLSGAVLIPALNAVLIQEAVTGLSHILSFSTGHAANACPPSPDTTKRTGPSSDTPSRKRQFVPTAREGEGED